MVITLLNKRFKDDYSRYDRLTDKGRVVEDICYTGDYYVLLLDSKQKSKANVVNIAAVLVLIAIHVAAGLLNQDSSRTFWIVVPYIMAFLPLGYMFIGAVNFWGNPVKMQRVQYETGVVRIKRSCIGSMVLIGIGAVLDILYMILYHDTANIGRELVYLLCHVLFLAAGVIYGKYYDRTYGGITIEPSQHKAQ